MYNQSVGFNIERVGNGQNVMSSRKSTLTLTRTHEKHLSGTGDAERIATQQTSSQNFGNMLLSQLDKTSELDTNVQSLTLQQLINPESVNEHDITIAATQAELALNITTNIINRAMDAYRTIVSLR